MGILMTFLSTSPFWSVSSENSVLTDFRKVRGALGGAE